MLAIAVPLKIGKQINCFFFLAHISMSYCREKKKNPLLFCLFVCALDKLFPLNNISGVSLLPQSVTGLNAQPGVNEAHLFQGSSGGAECAE